MWQALGKEAQRRDGWLCEVEHREASLGAGVGWLRECWKGKQELPSWAGGTRCGPHGFYVCCLSVWCV